MAENDLESRAPTPPRPRGAPAHFPRAGLAVGAIGTLAALAALREVAELPFGLLAIDLALGWGFVSLARALLPDDAPWDGLVAALAPYLVAGFLVRRVAHASDLLLPVAFRASLLLEAGILAAALLAYVQLGRKFGVGRALVAIGAVGVLTVLALVARLASLPPAPERGDLSILAAALALTVAALLVQAWGACRIGGKVDALKSPAALAISAGQLLDGAVTYLSVVDPLGLASSDYRERVPLSALVLDSAGPAYVALKWAVALAAGYVIAREGGANPERRIGIALTLVYLGLQPAFFSGTQLL